MKRCNIDDESTMNVEHCHDWVIDWDRFDPPMIMIFCNRCGMCMGGELEHTNPPEVTA